MRRKTYYLLGTPVKICKNSVLKKYKDEKVSSRLEKQGVPSDMGLMMT